MATIEQKAERLGAQFDDDIGTYRKAANRLSEAAAAKAAATAAKIAADKEFSDAYVAECNAWADLGFERAGMQERLRDLFPVTAEKLPEGKAA